MMSKLSFLIVLVMCVVFSSADAQAKPRHEKFKKDQKRVIRSLPDLKLIVSLEGPGTLVYYYFEGDSDAEAKPPDKTYLEIPIPDVEGKGLAIEKIEKGKSKGKEKLKGIKAFYYQFVPGQWEVLTVKSDHQVQLRRKQQRSPDDDNILLAEIEGPATIYYIKAKKKERLQFTPIAGYKVVEARTNQSLYILHNQDYRGVVKNIAVVQFPTRDTSDPGSKSQSTSKTKAEGISPKRGSASSRPRGGRWSVKNADKIRVKGPPY